MTDTSFEGKNKLTDFDVCELYIRCIATFVDRCTKYELDQETPFRLGTKLWTDTQEALRKYRKDNPDWPQAISRGPSVSSKNSK